MRPSGSTSRTCRNGNADVYRKVRWNHYVHIRVPDRAHAAQWYARHLGFEPVAEFHFRATSDSYSLWEKLASTVTSWPAVRFLALA